MTTILGIGLATLDTVLDLEAYPEENAKTHACGRRMQRGGNAANTLAVLADLGHRCRFGGLLGDDDEGRAILADLHGRGIETKSCRVLAGARSLVSYVLLNQSKGTRTIIHHRELPELSFQNFERIDLAGLDWIHFEGRNPDQTRLMLERVQALRPSLPRSLEIERARPGIELLLPHAEVLVFSRAFAGEWAFSSPRPFLEQVRRLAPRAHLVCAWGEEGGFALSVDGRFLAEPALPLERVVDSLGAGDTFNAGLIDGLVRTGDLATALSQANRLAGLKCGQHGFEGLGAKLSRLGL